MAEFIVFKDAIRPIADCDTLPPIEKYGLDWFAFEAVDLSTASIQAIGHRDTLEFLAHAVIVREALRLGNSELVEGDSEIAKRLRSLVVEHNARRNAKRLGL